MSGQEVQERPPRSSGTWVQVSEQRHTHPMEVVSAPTQRGLWEGRKQAGTKSGNFLTPCLPHAQPPLAPSAGPTPPPGATTGWPGRTFCC